MIAARLLEEKRPRLAAVTSVGGSVRAVVARIYARSALREHLVHAFRYASVILFREDAARDSRLIGHHNRRDENGIDARDRLGGAVDELHLLGTGQIVSILDDSTVAVEEYRRRKRVQVSEATKAANKRASSRSGTLRRSRCRRSSAIRPITGTA